MKTQVALHQSPLTLNYPTKELYSFSAWSNTYLVMTMVMMVGVVTTLLIKEPDLIININLRIDSRH
jgi:hypothetical protein